MLPRGATWIHHHPVKRAKLIPAVLLAENTDVVVFQECFDRLAMKIIRKKLMPCYPYVMGLKNRNGMTYKRAGGVQIFSKYPGREIASTVYSQCKEIDCIGHKGALLVEIAHPAHKFQLLGTHMQAGGGPDIKMSQHDEIAALLRKHEMANVPQFISGDFNTHKADTSLYYHLVRAINAEDGDITGPQQYSSDHELNDMEEYNVGDKGLIDFVFYRGNGVKYHAVTREVKMYQQQWNKKHKDLSDHFAVILKMQPFIADSTGQMLGTTK
jgi:hypothetical protein